MREIRRENTRSVTPQFSEYGRRHVNGSKMSQEADRTDLMQMQQRAGIRDHQPHDRDWVAFRAHSISAS